MHAFAETNRMRGTSPLPTCYWDMVCRLLKEDGVWINFGPLLYHWAQGPTGDTDDRFQRECSTVVSRKHLPVPVFSVKTSLKTRAGA